MGRDKKPRPSFPEPLSGWNRTWFLDWIDEHGTPRVRAVIEQHRREKSLLKLTRRSLYDLAKASYDHSAQQLVDEQHREEARAAQAEHDAWLEDRQRRDLLLSHLFPHTPLDDRAEMFDLLREELARG